MPEALSVTAGLGCLGYAPLNAYARTARTGSAISHEAKTARDAASAVIGKAKSSKSLFGDKLAMIEQLHVLEGECTQDDWDGNGALALNLEALENAEELVLTLPDGFPIPECAPEPDGSISLDWIISRHRLFSLSVGSSDRLAYAWLDGTDKGHGVARLDGLSLPARILREIQAMVNHATTTLRAV